MRAAREAAGMTLRTAAKMFGASHSAVGHWETGRNPIDLSRLYRLAKLYNVEVASLLIDFVDKNVLASLVVAAMAEMTTPPGSTARPTAPAKAKQQKQRRQAA